MSTRGRYSDFLYRSNSSSLKRENKDTNLEEEEAIISRQNEQIYQMKKKLSSLREMYHDEKQEFNVQIVQLQKKLSSIHRRQETLQSQLDELKNTGFDPEDEEIAASVIQEVWTTLINFRRQSMEKVAFEDNLMAVAETDQQYSPMPESPMKMVESGSDIVEVPQTPTVEISTPKTTKKRRVNRTPVPIEGSIAQRRERRNTPTVYYKEPSLRGTITPGDPYTFSLEGGYVTPTVPDGYTRETPRSSRRRK